MPSRALGTRLSPTDRDDLIAAFNVGTSQKHLAAKYGISVRSVKRLVHGNSNRPQATANRLTPGQRDAIIQAYTTVGTTQSELARAYCVDTSKLMQKSRSGEVVSSLLWLRIVSGSGLVDSLRV
ncbi:hypothetical protein [Glycomyces tarimensis]